MKKTSRKHGPKANGRKDPLVDEVRRIRAEVSKEHGHDLAKICEHLRELEANYAGKVIRKRSKRSSA